MHIAADSTTKIDAFAGSGAVSLDDSSFGGSVTVVVDLDDTLAFIGDSANVTVLGLGSAIEVRDGNYRDSELDIESAEFDVVNTDDDTLYVGYVEGLATGDEVTYENNEGTSIEGLTDDDGATPYFVIVLDDGRIKLAASAEDAEIGQAIDLTSSGLGEGHKFIRADNDDIIYLLGPIRLYPVPESLPEDFLLFVHGFLMDFKDQLLHFLDHEFFIVGAAKLVLVTV